MLELMKEIKNEVQKADIELTKFMGGNKAAGTRARNALQVVKTRCQELRSAIQAEKNKNKA